MLKFYLQQPYCFQNSLVFIKFSVHWQWHQVNEDFVLCCGSIWQIGTVYDHCCNLYTCCYVINLGEKINWGYGLCYMPWQLAVSLLPHASLKLYLKSPICKSGILLTIRNCPWGLDLVVVFSLGWQGTVQYPCKKLLLVQEAALPPGRAFFLPGKW